VTGNADIAVVPTLKSNPWYLLSVHVSVPASQAG